MAIGRAVSAALAAAAVAASAGALAGGASADSADPADSITLLTERCGWVGADIRNDRVPGWFAIVDDHGRSAHRHFDRGQSGGFQAATGPVPQGGTVYFLKFQADGQSGWWGGGSGTSFSTVRVFPGC